MQEYERPVLIVKNAVRSWFNARKIRVNRDAFRKLNDEVISILEKSLQRVIESKRRTCFPKDI